MEDSMNKQNIADIGVIAAVCIGLFLFIFNLVDFAVDGVVYLFKAIVAYLVH